MIDQLSETPVIERARGAAGAKAATAALDAVMDGIVVLDASGAIALMNPAAERMLGLRAFTTLGRPLADFADGAELVSAMIAEQRRASTGRGASQVAEVDRADGADLSYVRIRVRPTRDRSGGSVGVLFRLEDVSSAHKSDQLRNQYLSIVAHELRTPLTGIKTFSTMMAKGALGPLNDRQATVVETIREQSLRLEHQIDKLVNLGHIDSRDYGQDLERLDLCELIRQSVAPFEPAVADRGIGLSLELPSASCAIDGDRADLKRAIQALVENAIKFTRDGGRVGVLVTPGDDHSVEVAVTDDGIGIERRYHSRIFEKFFQVEDPLTRHHGGSGLGLFFVKSIVEAHGSRVRVDSAVGEGSRFSFSLALAPAACGTGASAADAAVVHNP